jgi:hypothetical protein
MERLDSPGDILRKIWSDGSSGFGPTLAVRMTEAPRLGFVRLPHEGRGRRRSRRRRKGGRPEKAEKV